MTIKIKFFILFFVLGCIRILPLVTTDDYMPAGVDNAFQIQSAQRLIDGKGLTFIGEYFESNPDISSPNYTYATGWPPGYALLIAGSMYIGIGLYASMVLITFLLTFFVLYGWWLLGDFYNLKKWELISFSLIVFLIMLVRNLIGPTDVFALGIFPVIFYIILKYKLTIRTLVLVGFLSTIIILFKYSALYIITGISLFIVFSYKKEIGTLIKNLIAYLTLPVISFFVITIINNYKTPSNSITGFNMANLIHSFISKFRIEWLFDYLKSIYLGTFRIDDIFTYSFKLIGIYIGNLPFYIFSLLLLVLTILISVKLYKRMPVFRDFIILKFCMFTSALLVLLFMSSRIAQQYWHPLEETRYIIPITPLILLTLFLFFKQLDINKNLKNLTYISIVFIVFLFSIPRIIYDKKKINDFNNIKTDLIYNIESVVNQYDVSVVPVVFSDNDYRSMLFVDTKFNALWDVCVLNKPHYFSKPTIVFIIQDLRQIKTLSTQYENLATLRDKYQSCQNEALHKTNWSKIEGNGFNLFYYYTNSSQSQFENK